MKIEHLVFMYIVIALGVTFLLTYLNVLPDAFINTNNLQKLMKDMTVGDLYMFGVIMLFFQKVIKQ